MNKIIDLRSDTVTRPSKEMLDFMMNTELGDDVFGEDPTVNQLQKMTAEMFGMEDALFCPSGTMTNQIAIKAHSQPGDEIICYEHAHVYKYEGGGIAFNSACSVKLLQSERGLINAHDIENAIRPDDIHFPKSSLVCLENTVNVGGGACYDLETIKAIKDVCKKNNLKLHLDGARLFNAIIEKKNTAKHIGELFDSISICLSKGLGAPVGSLLIGNEEFIKKSRRIRKVFGGGMRQAGIIAAAGIYALQNHVERLAEDHSHAKKIESALKNSSQIKKVLPVETNIVLFDVKKNINVNDYLEHLKKNNILAFGTGGQRIRFVTHLNIDEQMVNKVCEVV